MNLAPVILFVYNRLEHTKKTVEALKNNDQADETELFIYSDNYKANSDDKNKSKVKEVRDYIKTVEGFKEVHIIESEKNKGLASSIITGVTEVIDKYEKAIVLEDDLVTSNKYLQYMNNALEVFRDKNHIWSISGYTPPIDFKGYNQDLYITRRGCSWGWATWKNRWSTINWEKEYYKQGLKDKKIRKAFNGTGYDMSYMLELQAEGNIDSWAIRWCYNQFIQNKYTIYPVKSFVKNIGTDNSGTHSGDTKKYDVHISLNTEIIVSDNIIENKEISKRFRKFYSPMLKIVLSKYARKIRIYNIIRAIIYSK
ncbi:MAG: glycosyltransferase [Clostridium beijerinckii]